MTNGVKNMLLVAVLVVLAVIWLYRHGFSLSSIEKNEIAWTDASEKVENDFSSDAEVKDSGVVYRVSEYNWEESGGGIDIGRQCEAVLADDDKLLFTAAYLEGEVRLPDGRIVPRKALSFSTETNGYEYLLCYYQDSTCFEFKKGGRCNTSIKRESSSDEAMRKMFRRSVLKLKDSLNSVDLARMMRFDK